MCFVLPFPFPVVYSRLSISIYWHTWSPLGQRRNPMSAVDCSELTWNAYFRATAANTGQHLSLLFSLFRQSSSVNSLRLDLQAGYPRQEATGLERGPYLRYQSSATTSRRSESAIACVICVIWGRWPFPRVSAVCSTPLSRPVLVPR